MRYDDRVCLGQAREGLAQQSPRQDVPEAKGLAALTSTMSQIPGHSTVLESIVEHDHLHVGVFSDHRRRAGDLIGIGLKKDGGPRAAVESPIQHRQLITQGPRFRTIAAGKNSHLPAFIPQPAGQPLDDRRFSGSPGGYVSDADHRPARDASSIIVVIHITDSGCASRRHKTVRRPQLPRSKQRRPVPFLLPWHGRLRLIVRAAGSNGSSGHSGRPMSR